MLFKSHTPPAFTTVQGLNQYWATFTTATADAHRFPFNNYLVG